MSHLLKEYSKNLEVKPTKVVVNKHFFPVIPEKYIVIYNEQGIEAKKYRYYALVLDLIKNVLNSLDIKVVIIGDGDNITNRADYYYSGLSFRKNAYIVSKSLLFISVDNAESQYASSQGIKTICIYGNIYSSITTPYWSNKNNKIDIEPDWDCKPCMNVYDPEDAINKIPAEEIANSILKLLGKKLTLQEKVNFKTKAANKNKEFCVDVVPTEYFNMHEFKENVINLRLDLGNFPEKVFQEYLKNHKCNIILKDSIINAEIITAYSNNIENITLIVENEQKIIPEEYLLMLKTLGIKFLFLVKDEKILDNLRFRYFEEKVDLYNPQKEKPKNVSKKDKFISFKTVIDGSKSYKSTYHWKNNIDNSDYIVDNADYWEESDYFYIYEQS